MSQGKKHPHIERPSIEQLTSLLENKSPALRGIYLDIHRLVLETLPGVAYSVDCKDGMLSYGAKQFGYDGWGMAALSAHSKWVTFMFMRGVDLDDPEKLLEGSGKKMRHVKIHSPEQFKENRSALLTLIEAASKLKQQA